MSGKRILIAISTAALAISSAAFGDETTLLKQAREFVAPLPRELSAAGPPANKDIVYLGRLLFFEPRITVDGTVSCATCHQPSLYGTDARATSIGVKQRLHPRNAPTVLNAALNFVNHWRGDRESVEDQATQALTAPISSGHDEQAVADRLERIPGYGLLFKAAFPGEHSPITTKNAGMAIGAFERTLLTPSPFDAYLAGNIDALSPSARAGLQTFINTGCVACHRGAGLGGDMYRKFGVLEDYWTATRSRNVDKGRIEVTNDPADLHVFRVAGLRNVAMTPPYFHDGSVAALPDAVRIMARLQLGVALNDADTGDIVPFLASLTGGLPADFAAAPVLPPGAVPAPK